MLASIEGGASTSGGLSATEVLSDTTTLRCSGEQSRAVCPTSGMLYRLTKLVGAHLRG